MCGCGLMVLGGMVFETELAAIAWVTTDDL